MQLHQEGGGAAHLKFVSYYTPSVPRISDHIACLDGTEPFRNGNMYGPAIQPPCADICICKKV